MSTAALLAVLIGLAQPAPAAQPGVIPTGVITSKLPRQSGYHARGEDARAWVTQAQAIARGDDPIPDRSASPWLVLIGPDDATRQAAGQLDPELAARVNVARYEPDDPRLDRGLRAHYPGGTFALVLGPDRSIAWRGLVDLAEIVHHLRRLLGLEPDAPDLPPWLPGPDGPRPDGGPMTAILAWLVAQLGAGPTLGLVYLLGHLTGHRLLAAARNALVRADGPGRP